MTPMTLELLRCHLAYVPFVSPLETAIPHMTRYWLWLMLPLVAVISVVYKGTKVQEVRELPLAATALAVQILFFLAVIAGGLYLVTWIAIYHMPAGF